MTDEEILNEFTEWWDYSDYKYETGWNKDWVLEGYLAGRRKGEEEIKTLQYKLRMVSKLASEKGQFYNPFDVQEAKLIRDDVLKGRPNDY